MQETKAVSSKTKQEMSKELNGLLNLNVDWIALKRADLERIHHFFVEEMTLPRAVSLNAAGFRLRLESMPLLKVLRERAEIIRQDHQRQTLLQQGLKKNPATLVERGSIQPQSPDRKRQCYIS